MFELDLNKHLDSDEKMLLFLRPARIGYFFQYVLVFLFFFAGIFFLFARAGTASIAIEGFFSSILGTLTKGLFSTLSLIAFAFAIILGFKIEWSILSRRYGITSERVMHSKGIFYEKFHSAKYGFITDTALEQSFWDKIVNTGTLEINTAGTDDYEIVFKKIADPIKIKKLINDHVPDRTPDISPNVITPKEKEIFKEAAKKDL